MLHYESVKRKAALIMIKWIAARFSLHARFSSMKCIENKCTQLRNITLHKTFAVKMAEFRREI